MSRYGMCIQSSDLKILQTRVVRLYNKVILFFVSGFKKNFFLLDYDFKNTFTFLTSYLFISNFKKFNTIK